MFTVISGIIEAVISQDTTTIEILLDLNATDELFSIVTSIVFEIVQDAVSIVSLLKIGAATVKTTGSKPGSTHAPPEILMVTPSVVSAPSGVVKSRTHVGLL